MTHLDEGTILAMRDGAWETEAALQHTSSCTLCSHELGRARARAALVSGALSVLDEDVDTEAAKAVVRRRLDARHGAVRGGAWRWMPLGKAAALVLIAAGAASALPGSPFRNWWRASEPAAVPTVAPASGIASAPGGAIEVPVTAGRIAGIVRGVSPGTEVEVVWVDAPTARVAAPAGSVFAYGGGRAEVDAADGPLRVEMPRAAELATLEVDGVEYVRRAGDLVSVAGPATQRTDARILFVAPER